MLFYCLVQNDKQFKPLFYIILNFEFKFCSCYFFFVIVKKTNNILAHFLGHIEAAFYFSSNICCCRLLQFHAAFSFMHQCTVQFNFDK